MRCACPVVLMCCAVAACADRGGIDLQRMKTQPRYDAYAAAPSLPGGMTMQTPPRGTVPVERDSAGARVDMSLLERGRNRYDIYCAPCHAVDGSAATPVAGAMRLRPPPPLAAGPPVQLTDARIFQVISEGYGLMPSYADELTPADRRAIVLYVRALQLRSHAHVSGGGQ